MSLTVLRLAAVHGGDEGFPLLFLEPFSQYRFLNVLTKADFELRKYTEPDFQLTYGPPLVAIPNQHKASRYNPCRWTPCCART